MPAPTIVQHVSAFASGATTVTATFASAVTAGNMIIAFGGVGSVTPNVPTMTGETFTAWAGASITVAATDAVATWAVDSAVGGQTGVTLTASGASDMHLHIIEVHGQAASPRDASGNKSSATLSVSTSGATTVAADLVLGFFFDNANNQTFTAGAGYAQVEQTNNTGGGDAGFSESKAVAATGVQTATATATGADTIEQIIVAVAGTAAAGGTVSWARMPVYFLG